MHVESCIINLIEFYKEETKRIDEGKVVGVFYGDIRKVVVGYWSNWKPVTSSMSQEVVKDCL